MKNVYVKPEIEVIEFEMEVYMLDVSAGEDLPGNGGSGGDSEGGIEIDANRHRGEWGNLWAED